MTHVAKNWRKVPKLTAAATALAVFFALTSPALQAQAVGTTWGVWDEDTEGQLSFGDPDKIDANFSLTGHDGYRVNNGDDGSTFTAETEIGRIFGSSASQFGHSFYVEAVDGTDAVLTVTFDEPVPMGRLGFAIGDVDFDDVKVEATTTNGDYLSGEEIVGRANNPLFNFCNVDVKPLDCVDENGNSLGYESDKPYFPAGFSFENNYVVVLGDTRQNQSSRGASVWFRPSRPVVTLTFTTSIKTPYELHGPSDPVLDENGDPILDENGDPILHEEGSRVLDENSDPIRAIVGSELDHQEFWIAQLPPPTPPQHACETPGARSASLESQSGGHNIFLGGNFIEVGIGNRGSFGTNEDKPEGFFGVPEETNRIGLVSDFDGFCNGFDDPVDYFVPGSPYEAYGIGIAGNETEYWGFASSLGPYNKSDNMSDVSPSDVTMTNTSSQNTLSATVVTIFRDSESNPLAEVTQNISFGVNDKEFLNSVSIKNISNFAWTEVKYSRGVDPDNTRFSFDGDYSTNNFIAKTYAEDSVTIVQAQALYSDLSNVVFNSDTLIPIQYISNDPGAVGYARIEPFGGQNPFVPSSDVKGNLYRGDNTIQLNIAKGALPIAATVSTSYITSLDSSVLSVPPPAPLISQRIVRPDEGQTSLAQGNGENPPQTNPAELETLGKIGPGEGIEFTSEAGALNNYADALYINGLKSAYGVYNEHPVPFVYSALIGAARDLGLNLCNDLSVTYRIYEDESSLKVFADSYLSTSSAIILADPEATCIVEVVAPTRSSRSYNYVIFDANGGIGVTASVSNHTTTALPAHSFVKPGFVFTSWNTKADGTGIAYADKATYTFVSDLTLYAQWVPEKSAVKVRQYISTFAGDKPTLTPKMRTTIASWIKKLPKNSVITCQGSTSGSKVTAFDRRLASTRAKNVCVEAVKQRSDLTYSVQLNPSSSTKVSARHVWMIQN